MKGSAEIKEDAMEGHINIKVLWDFHTWSATVGGSSTQ